jgi:ATP-dependent helicase/nuclease subunit A
MESGCAVLRGQIDLLFQAADGSWNMVDYKSDQVTPDQIASHAEKYALQMHIYAAAAERHLRQRPAKARLYFLRPAQSYEIEIPPHHRESFQREIEESARQLIDFRRHPEIHSLRSSHCSDCAYQELCESRMFSKRN